MRTKTNGQVLVTRKIPPNGMDILTQHCEVEVWPARIPPSREELREMVADVDAVVSLLTDEFDAEMMDRAPELQVISNYAVGYDNIDVEEATRRGIAVTNTPGVLTETTADMAFALLLAAARRVPEGDAAVRNGQWLSWEPTYMLGRDLHNSRLGVVGMGRIGRAVARRAAGFSVDLVYADPTRNEELEKELGAEYVELDELLTTSDFISVHVPLIDQTYHLIDRERLNSMKEGAVLVNTSRGEVIDERALIEVLRRDYLAAAGLDVFSEEPLSEDHPFTELDNVVLTPHLGSATINTRREMARLAAENAVTVLNGQRPEHIVNPQVLE